jgi:kinesin family protein 5
MYGDNENGSFNLESSRTGIVPRATTYLFDLLTERVTNSKKTYSVKCSFIELYNDQVRDLLDASRRNLKVRETPSAGVWIEDVTEETVHNTQDVFNLIYAGLEFRAMSTTMMNESSSRSHCIFTFNINQVSLEDSTTVISKLNLVDLAGSERVNRSGATGLTLTEAKNINQSLSCLGNCILALTKKTPHVPYRESKLTHILKESIGGNCKTFLVITLSPLVRDVDETISTMRFGVRAKFIQSVVRVNNIKNIQSLEAEIQALKKYISNMKLEGKGGSSPKRAVSDDMHASPASANFMSSELFVAMELEQQSLRETIQSLRAESEVMRAKESRYAVEIKRIKQPHLVDQLKVEIESLKCKLEEKENELKEAESAFDQFKAFNDDLLKRFAVSERARAALEGKVKYQEQMLRRRDAQKSAVSNLVTQLKDKEQVLLSKLSKEQILFDSKIRAAEMLTEELNSQLKVTSSQISDLTVNSAKLEASIRAKDNQLKDLERAIAGLPVGEESILNAEKQNLTAERIKMVESLTEQTEQLSSLMGRLQSALQEQEESKAAFRVSKDVLEARIIEIRDQQSFVESEIILEESLLKDSHIVRVPDSHDSIAPVAAEPHVVKDSPNTLDDLKPVTTSDASLSEVLARLNAAELELIGKDSSLKQVTGNLERANNRILELETLLKFSQSRSGSLSPSFDGISDDLSVSHIECSAEEAGGPIAFSVEHSLKNGIASVAVPRSPTPNLSWRRLLRVPGSIVSFPELQRLATSDIHILPCKRVDELHDVPGRASWFICLNDRDLVTMHSISARGGSADKEEVRYANNLSAVIHSAHALVDIAAKLVIGSDRRLSIHFNDALDSSPIMVYELDNADFVVRWVSTYNKGVDLVSAASKEKTIVRGQGEIG